MNTAVREPNLLKKHETSKLIFSLLVAALLWFVMFSPWTAPHVNFWICMSASALGLTCFAFTFGGRQSFGIADNSSLIKTCILGLSIAVLLWIVFYIGDKVSQLLFSFSRAQVNLIYNIKGNTSPTLLSLLLLFIIGPAEEIFWRGYIQRTLSRISLLQAQ